MKDKIEKFKEIKEKSEEQENETNIKDIENKSITDLPGVGAATAEKLQQAGYDNLMSIAVASPAEIVEVTSLGESVARKIIQSARKNLKMGFETGDNILKRRQNVVKINIGSKSFNELLGGGFETGAIIEAFGEYGSGKTQIAHVLAVNTIKQEPNSYVVFIDTENTFRPERIIEIAKGAGVDPNKILKNIMVARAYNSDHQMLLSEKVEDIIKKDNKKVRTVIVDSLTAHFRAEFVGRGTLAERQQKLNRHMHTLLKLADVHNICVYVTNQVMAKPDTFFGDPTRAIGGHIVAHASTFRMYLRKGKKGTRVAKLVDSPNLPENEISFVIEKDGIRDI